MNRKTPKNQVKQNDCFSIRLRCSTQEVHSLAEQTGFIRGFLRGTASHQSYLQLLLDLLPVYQEMEYHLDRLCELDSKILIPFHFRELYRSEALKRDIDYISDCCTENGQLANLRASAHSSEYVERVRSVALSAEPVRLVGHLYTRYLGDLSGGQILAKIARNSMRLDCNRGLDFYEFEQIKNIAAMKKSFRAALDTLEGDAILEEIVTEEAILSFRYNIDIFNSLRGNSLVSIWRNFHSFIKQRVPARSHA
jgi:heme oxygenase